jgi:hypothetical protein
MGVETILITEADMAQLADLLEAERRWPMLERTHVRALTRKLDRAAVVHAKAIPADVFVSRTWTTETTRLPSW